MKPLPSQDTSKESARTMPALPISTNPGSYSTANRKVASCPIQRVYPWLLFASTAVAATFCLAYITKPVILAGSSPSASSPSEKVVASNSITPDPSGKIIPDETSLPGDPAAQPGAPSGNNPPASPLEADFEETNIRIQHVLDAESPSGDISRIVIDVPVLYRSRNLRWTQTQAEEARVLLGRLAGYQDNVRALRTEGMELRDAWNKLMSESIPAEALRADSPSLPANQQDMLSPATSSDTTETIKLQKPTE